MRRFILGLCLVSLASLPVAMASPDKPLNEDEQKAYLDQYYPFIEQGAEPPGRSIPHEKAPDLSKWVGQRGWRTRHGRAAVVRWDHGRPNNVSDALYPDGSRGEVRHTLDHGYGRRSSGERRWVYGTISIRPDDVLFVDGSEQPTYTPPAPGSDANLERDLANDRAFLAALKDDTFAHAVYVVFRNREFVRAADLGIWSCGDRQAAHLVPALRGLGESYHDYYLRYDFPGTWPDDRPQREATLRSLVDPIERMLATPKPAKIPIGTNFRGKLIETEEQAEQARDQLRRAFETNRPRLEADLAKFKRQMSDFAAEPDSDVVLSLRAHLTRLGWRTLNGDDERRMGEDAMRQGLDLLEDIKRREALPPSEPGAWWRDRASSSGRTGMRMIRVDALAALTPDQQAVRRGLGRRIDALASSGRLSKDEYQALQNRDDAVQQRIGGYDGR